MGKFIEIDRDNIELSSNLERFLQTDPLAPFIVDIVEQLDISEIENCYKGCGSQAYPPRMMLSLLFYCYAVGIFSTREIEDATYLLIPVIYITGNTHPDHSTINTFRKRFLPQLRSLFFQVLLIAHEMGVLKLVEVSTDGTKVEANASKHRAMSWEYANKLEAQLNAEVDELLKKADEAEYKNRSDIDIVEELKHREERLKKIDEVKTELEARAKIRYEEEQAEYEEELKKRQAEEEKTGRKKGGRKPKPPEPGPRAKDQVNFTDEESRIMPVSGGGFEQCYNAQASVDMGSLVIIGNHVSQNPNDKQELKPALEEMKKVPDEIGAVGKLGADAGFHSEENVKLCEEHGIEGYIPCSRQEHNQPLEERLEACPELPENATPVEAMKHRLKTPEGKNFYSERKTTIEPVFGIIKSVMGFRRFSLRGLKAVAGEWNLVCIAFNLKRMWTLRTSSF